jgi:hypothetical protein
MNLSARNLQSSLNKKSVVASEKEIVIACLSYDEGRLAKKLWFIPD